LRGIFSCTLNSAIAHRLTRSDVFREGMLSF
jgi:hypothetical protein